MQQQNEPNLHVASTDGRYQILMLVAVKITWLRIFAVYFSFSKK
jgi:hypothetical protein